jgi:hypothetical protein
MQPAKGFASSGFNLHLIEYGDIKCFRNFLEIYPAFGDKPSVDWREKPRQVADPLQSNHSLLPM